MLHPEHHFILVAPNKIISGVLTAVNWIRPIACKQSVVTTLAQASEKLLPGDVEDLEKLHALCLRDRAERTSL